MLILISKALLKIENKNFRSLIRPIMATNKDKTSSSSNIRSDKTQNSPSSNLIKPQIYDFILVLDFEATCDDNIKLIPQVCAI